MRTLKSKSETRKIPARFFFFYSTRSIAAVLGIPDEILAQAFSWPQVLTALDRLAVKEIGAAK
jgi:hypothetical protein